MKIGIVTFFRVTNYGAMLQAYALRCHLERLGHSVVFVRHPLLSVSRPSLFSCFITRSVLGLRNRLKKYVRYPMVHFADNFPQTALCETLNDLQTETAGCDMLLAGSDQVWNPAWFAKKYLDVVMLGFASEMQGRVSYAASFGTKVWPADQNAEKACSLLRRLHAIGVREKSGLQIIEALSGRKDAQCLLDPTMLQTAEFYEKLFAGISKLSGRYVFKYILDEWDDGEESDRSLEFLVKELKIKKIVSDRTWLVGLLSPICRLVGASGKIPVPQWLARLSAAALVYTNSFHGTVFSIIFHRPFVTLLLNGTCMGMNERIITLLKALGLENRAVAPSDRESILDLARQPIDWVAVDRRLAEHREKSFAFIRAFSSLVPPVSKCMDSNV